MAELASIAAPLTRELITRFTRSPEAIRALEALVQDLTINVPALLDEIETALSLIDGAPLAPPPLTAADLEQLLSAQLSSQSQLSQIAAEVAALRRRVNDLESAP